MAEAQPIEDWSTLPWRKLEQHVYRLQKRMYRAALRGNVAAVRSLQRLVMKSQSARAIAVRRVTQDNQGKKTAGIDGVKSLAPHQRQRLVAALRDHRHITARPVRRVYIPKPGKSELRPLGIPVMLDRAHQALVKQALEPEWEARFAPNSYGFRPGRSCHDAIGAIFNEIRLQPKYVLDADITGCFDNIDHDALLAKLDTFPTMRQAIKAWLKAGVMVDGTITPTDRGSPQGGVISPLLANIALCGLEEAAATAYGTRKAGPHLIRYADDFVVFHPTLEGIEAAKDKIATWLAGMGLELKPSKTRITHTLRCHDGNVGFDFLGFTIRQFPAGKCHTGTNAQGKPLGFKTCITPSKEATKRHVAEIGRVVRQRRSVPQKELIGVLNPKIRGWANYYRTVVASATFARCDNHLFHVLRRWAFRRHPQKRRTWIVRRYWRPSATNKWRFATADGLALRRHGQTAIRRHVKVRGNASPFDGNLVYWARRLTRHPLLRATLGRLVQRQQGKCAGCGLLFREGDLIEIDHLVPTHQGGNDTFDNKQALHRHCHDQKTARDGTQQPSRAGGIRDKHPIPEEPDAEQLARPVLEAGGGPRGPSPS